MICFFFFKQKTAYEIYQCDWSSDVCSSDLFLRCEVCTYLGLFEGNGRTPGGNGVLRLSGGQGDMDGGGRTQGDVNVGLHHLVEAGCLDGQNVVLGRGQIGYDEFTIDVGGGAPRSLQVLRCDRHRSAGNRVPLAV